MSEKKSDYTNRCQQRLLQVIVVLAGNEFHGLLPGEIAKAVGTTPHNITRDLDNLRQAGVAEQIQDTGRWCLGPKLIQIALAFMRHRDQVARRVDEMNQRYTRTPN